MTDGNPVQLVNRDGKIVGIDPETGETVPIKMGEGLGTEAEPIPNTSHFEGVSTESLDTGSASTDDLHSDSRVPTVVIREDSGTYYAIGQNDRIDSGTVARDVIQSAIDLIHSIWNDRHDSLPYSNVGTIDCNNLEIAISDPIVIKGGVGLKNLHIDATDSDYGIDSDDSSVDRGIRLENIWVENTNSTGLRIRRVNHSDFIRCYAIETGGSGFIIAGSLYNDIRGLVANDCDSHGFNTGNVGGVQSNHNYWSNCTANSAGSNGFHIRDAWGNLFNGCAAEQSGNVGFSDGGRGNAWVDCWAESNDSDGFVATGQNCYVASIRSYGGDVRMNADHSTVESPYLTQGAVEGFDGVPINVVNASNAEIIEADLTRIDGWGDNDGDPTSTGAWNGEGFEGASVVDTTNDNAYIYRGGSWVAI